MFDDRKADMEANKKLSTIVTELFLRGRKVNISLVFKSQSSFQVPKTIRLNATHYHSSDIDFKDFMKLYQDHTKEPYSFLENNTTLSSDNPLRFGKNLF